MIVAIRQLMMIKVHNHLAMSDAIIHCNRLCATTIAQVCVHDCYIVFNIIDFFSMLIDVISMDDVQLWHGIVLAVCLLVSIIVHILILARYYHELLRAAFDVSSALNAIVFDKVINKNRSDRTFCQHRHYVYRIHRAKINRVDQLLIY